MSLAKNIVSRLSLSATKEKILANLFWSILGKLVNLASGLFLGILVARYLGPEQYGLMDYVISYVFLFQTIATFGLDAIEVREEARAAEPYQKIIGTAFGLKIILAAVLMVSVVLTSLITETDSYTTILIAVYSFVIILNSFNVIRNYFISIVQNEYVVKAEITRTLIGVAIKIVLLALHSSLIWFIAAYVLDFILVASGYCMAYHVKVGKMKEWRFDFSYAKFLLRESFPLLLTSTAVIVYQRIDHVMIGQLIDNKSVGYYSVASRFVDVLIYIPIMLSQTITPVLVSARNRNESEYICKGQQFMNLSLWCSLFAAAATSLSAYWVVRFTFGTAYLPAVAILQVLSFKTATVALSNTAGAMLVTEGLQRYAIIRDITGCIVCVTLNYFLLPRYGIIAAAWIAIASNVAAGYLSDAFIPPFNHLFTRQTRALLWGWKDVVAVRSVITRMRTR